MPRHDAPTGTRINGGAFRVPAALGNKVIHAYSDFLLHDIDRATASRCCRAGFAETAPLIRTAPLWALRTRNRLMHDGLSFTREEAIARHGGQASATRRRFDELTPQQQGLVLRFLNSL